MRLIGILVSVTILALLLAYSFKRLYTPQPNSADLDTSLPAVERQVGKMQDEVKNYDETMKSYENIINQSAQ